MKLRIKGDSIRLRLSQTEVTNFLETDECHDAIHFGDSTLHYSLLASDSATNVGCSFIKDRVTVTVPLEQGKKWASDETEVGFSADQDNLYILVEKDFACLTPRAREDESDNFPNPNQAC